nr:MAG TPA: hypothetical protein [Caudoviricetes sp.]
MEDLRMVERVVDQVVRSARYAIDFGCYRLFDD